MKEGQAAEDLVAVGVNPLAAEPTIVEDAPPPPPVLRYTIPNEDGTCERFIGIREGDTETIEALGAVRAPDEVQHGDKYNRADGSFTITSREE